jgi:prolyl-tRNA editing enzyme YbaK/EbsC (Cys-tRNA(Pro) deacylase)
MTLWPEPVERIASFLRQSKAHGRLEELPAGVEEPPGPGARAEAFDCDGRTLVALVPDVREIDRLRLARRAACRELRPAAALEFPFQGTRVLVDRSLLLVATVWLEAGSARHVLGLSPRQLLRLTRAETGTFLVQDERHPGEDTKSSP